MENKVYLFQDWEFGSITLEVFGEWDKNGEILEKLKSQDIYVHTDSQWGFLIISLNKEKLLKVAERKKQEQIKEYESKLKWLKTLDFNDK